MTIREYLGWTTRDSTKKGYADLDTRFSSYNTKAETLVCDGATDDYVKFNALVNGTMQPNGGRLDVIGVPRIGTSMVVPANVELNFVGGAYIAPDVGVTVTLSNFTRSYAKMFGGGGQVKFTTGSVAEVLPKWFGATLDGVADDTLPFIAAIKASPIEGVPIQFVGRLLLTGNGANIAAAINASKSFTLEGRNGFGSRGINSPPEPLASIVYGKGLTGYFFSKAGAINESWTLRNVAFDLSNGTGTAGGSTTCPGIYAANGLNALNVECINVQVSDTLYAHNTTLGLGNQGRAVFDLDFSTWATFVDCQFAYCQNGRLFFTDNGAAQFHARRCEITAFREGYYHRASGNVLYDSCVIEACTVAGASYRTNITHRNPWWESAGITGAPIVATGLAPRNHGLVYGAGVLDGAVNCYVSSLGGSTVIEDAQIQGFGIGATILAWFECLGTPNGLVNGGYFYLSGKKATPDRLLAITMAYGTAQRDANMQVEIWDRWGADSANGVGLFVYDATPARYTDIGAGRIQMNDASIMQFMRIARGSLIGDVQNGGFSNTPSVTQWPKGDQWRAGDRLDFPPGVGIGPTQTTGVDGVRCYGAGTAAPGWQLGRLIHAVGVDPGDANSNVILFAQQEIIIYNTPITAVRTITLPAPAALPVNTSGAGLKYRVIRTALCTGAFNLNIQRSDATLLKALGAAGTWADFEWSTAGNWILTAAGAL